jgi:hypothetical protein
MRELVDGIQLAPRKQRFRRLGKPRLIDVIIFIIFGVGLIGATSTIVRDIQTWLTVKSLLPPGHYLVLLQNNAELRPSGGFIGSFAVVDIGVLGVKKYIIDTNIYKRDKAFTDQNSIQPPAAFSRNMDKGLKWAMRDANWDLDFREAAARTAWFYEQEGGEPVDGVIAINASVVQDVLQLTGPLTIPRLDSLLTSDSYFSVLAKEVEQDYFKDPVQLAQNEPKSILKDLLPVLLSRIKQPVVAVKLTNLMRQELTEKHVQIFHTTPALEERIVRAGWGGVIDQGLGDYLLLNNASVGGKKSSLFVGQETVLDITTLPNGSLQHALTVTRTHTGTGVWPDYRNNNYIRVAVPLGSALSTMTVNGLKTQAVDTTIEAQKTVFGIRFDTDPGHTSTLQSKYIVPVADQIKPFTLKYQKQSGTLSEKLRVTVDGQTKFDGLVVKDILIR